jgi:outer membrane receptor protein involved in Fe transport
MDNYSRQEYEFSLSGPVPFASDNLTYSLHGQIVDKDQQKLSYSGPQFQTAVQTKINYRISPRNKLQFIGMGSWINSRSVGYWEAKYPGGYIPGYGLIAPKIDSEEYDFNRNYIASLKWTHTISNQTFYEIQAGFKYNTFDRKNKDWNDRDGDGDFNEFLNWKKIMIPEDESDPNCTWGTEWRYTSDDMQWLWVDAHPPSNWQGGWKWGVPGKSQWRQIWVLNRSNYEYSKECRFLTGTINEKELEPFPIQLETESELYPTVPDANFYYYGDAHYYYDNENQTFSLKADLTSQCTPQHLIKGGINLALTKMDMLRIQGWRDALVDDYNVQPVDIAAYIQDKMEFEGMIVNAGVRLDYYDPGRNIIYPGDFNRPCDFLKGPEEEGYLLNPKTAKPFISVSPRLGISHPIREASVLHFTYGHFYQRPEYRFWYQNMAYKIGYWRGNPSMKPEKTISYEAGIKQNIGQFLIGISLFYKDLFDMTNWTRAGERPLYDYTLYINRDWADVRGFELTVRKLFSDYFSGNLNYTFMIAKGSNSTPYDEYTQEGPERPYYLDWDQRHTLNANLSISLPENWGPAWNLNILYAFNSPQPYTPPTRNPQREVNTARLKSRMHTDIKLTKRFTLTNNLKALFLFEGYNIFNRKNLLFLDDALWYEQTGNPEGYNLNPQVWDSRRFLRFGIGFEF